MTPAGDPTEVLVRRLLKEVLPWNLAQKELGPDTPLEGELGIDSLRKLALAFRLEEETGADLTRFTGDLGALQTVGELISAARHLVEGGSHD